MFAEYVHFIAIQLEDVPCGATVLLPISLSIDVSETRLYLRQQWKRLLLYELTRAFFFKGLRLKILASNQKGVGSNLVRIDQWIAPLSKTLYPKLHHRGPSIISVL